jgi:hypothetical protein
MSHCETVEQITQPVGCRADGDRLTEPRLEVGREPFISTPSSFARQPLSAQCVSVCASAPATAVISINVTLATPLGCLFLPRQTSHTLGLFLPRQTSHTLGLFLLAVFLVIDITDGGLFISYCKSWFSVASHCWMVLGCFQMFWFVCVCIFVILLGSPLGSLFSWGPHKT